MSFLNRLKVLIKSIVNRVLMVLNLYEIVTVKVDRQKRDDMEKEFWEINKISGNTSLTSLERRYSLYKAVEYIIKNNIPGNIVECGVWKGGSMILCALALLKMNNKEKKLFLYDTYEGMSEPTEIDICLKDNRHFSEFNRNFEKNICLNVPLEEVKKNLETTGYPKEKIIYIEGKVEDTIPGIIPEKISILRLDTDFYESTYHEFEYLFPRLVKGGVLIVDDYGVWKGSRKATDDYIKENHIKMYLNRIDDSGRIAVKL
jgi:hypothetical protein